MKRENFQTKQKGLTLVELMVTLLILAMLTTMTLRSTAGLKQQARYDQTISKLGQIRAAIVGEHNAVYAGQRLLSGFAVDTGILPENLKQLVDNDGSLMSHRSIQPLFDPTPDANGINNGGEITLSSGLFSLKKGYNPPYLSPQTGNDNDAFRDGFGNDNDDIDLDGNNDGNYGWLVTSIPDNDDRKSMQITSFGGGDGSRGIKNPDDLYEKDISAQAIRKQDWMASLSGYDVIIRTYNKQFEAKSLKASLLVFTQPDDPALNGKWKRLTSNSRCLAGDNDTSAPPACIDGVSEQVLSFSWLNGVDNDSSWIPAGQHLLVLDNDNKPYNYPDNDNLKARKITLFPDTLPETITFILN